MTTSSTTSHKPSKKYLQQRRRLAKVAREFAYECAEGKQPLLGRCSFDACAFGVVATRAGIDPDEAAAWAPYEARSVFVGNDNTESATERQEHVVFPLLALADALEAN